VYSRDTATVIAIQITYLGDKMPQSIKNHFSASSLAHYAVSLLIYTGLMFLLFQHAPTISNLVIWLPITIFFVQRRIIKKKEEAKK
jgi:hypothetical protein